MPIVLVTPKARETIEELERLKPDKHKKVLKALGLMQANLRHPGLHTHAYDSLTGPNGEKVYEAYAENHTAGAYRIFWYYGPGEGEITVIAITPHP